MYSYIRCTLVDFCMKLMDIMSSEELKIVTKWALATDRLEELILARLVESFPAFMKTIGSVLRHWNSVYAKVLKVISSHEIFRPKLSMHFPMRATFPAHVTLLSVLMSPSGNFSHRYCVQISSVAHPTSYQMGSKGSFPWSKVAEDTNPWSYTSTPPIRLRVLVLS